VELQSINQRLRAIQGAIVYPLLVIDRSRRLLGFNPPARHLFGLTDNDEGRDIRTAGTLPDARELTRLLDAAYARKAEPREQIEIRERSFELQIQLFKGPKGEIEGAVASFVENTEIVAALAESRVNRQRLSDIFEGTPAIVTMKDLSGVYQYANRRF